MNDEGTTGEGTTSTLTFKKHLNFFGEFDLSSDSLFIQSISIVNPLLFFFILFGRFKKSQRSISKTPKPEKRATRGQLQ